MDISKQEKAIKAYAEKFGLEWISDVSEWEDDMPGTMLGGAFRPSMNHMPPEIFICSENIFDDELTHRHVPPYIYFTRDINVLDGDEMAQRIVSVEELENAVSLGIQIIK